MYILGILPKFLRTELVIVLYCVMICILFCYDVLTFFGSSIVIWINGAAKSFIAYQRFSYLKWKKESWLITNAWWHVPELKTFSRNSLNSVDVAWASPLSIKSKKQDQWDGWSQERGSQGNNCPPPHFFIFRSKIIFLFSF